MSYLVVGILIAYVLIALGLITLLLYYGNLAYQCDSLIGFWCHTDWKCADINGNTSGTPSPIGATATTSGDSGTYDATGNLIPGDQMHCHLKGLYGVDPGPDCPGQPVRVINPCMQLTSPDADRNDPNSYTGDVISATFPCDVNQSSDGMCSGNFNTYNNISGLTNNSLAAGAPSGSSQYGIGPPPASSPFDCACYFGANVIANSGSGVSTVPFSGNTDTGGGVYNISGMACSQIINYYHTN